MNTKLYKNYVSDIANYLQEGKRGEFRKSMNYSNFDGSRLNESQTPWGDKFRNELNFNSLSGLSNITGIKANYHQRLGAHPEFSYLKEKNAAEYHYITTMFIDIKKSTDLFKKYYPETVARISRTIQDAAIHTCWYFDGYVHRLQGDGLMVYFGGKNTSIAQSTTNAFNASSFFTYFVKNDLKELFNEQGIGRIYTRVGLDTGEKEDVLWHLAGMGECSEITTCSLHTSLASKMQAQTVSNGIMVGDNVLKYKEIDSLFFKHTQYVEEGKKSDYIFSIPDENFYYKQHDFNWQAYLNKHPLVNVDEDGNLLFIGEKIISDNMNSQNVNYMQKNVTDFKPYFG
jgi:adenylate cyclase